MWLTGGDGSGNTKASWLPENNGDGPWNLDTDEDNASQVCPGLVLRGSEDLGTEEWSNET